MKRVVCFFSLTGLLCAALFAPTILAGQCEYGSAYAWFKTSDGSWEKATAHPLLHRGEVFEIQILVTITTILSVFFIKLHEFGTPVYEVLEGPTAMEQLLECRNASVSGQRYTYIWKMRVKEDTPWVNGYAPLEVFVQFNKNDTASLRVHFDVITGFIVDTPKLPVSQGPLHDIDSQKNTEVEAFPDLTMGPLILTILLFSILLRGQKKRR